MVDNPRKALGILAQTFFIVIAILIVHLILSLIAMIIGAVYLGQCTIQQHIPIYLIVIGIAFIIQYLSIIPYVSKNHLTILLIIFLLDFFFDWEEFKQNIFIGSWHNLVYYFHSYWVLLHRLEYCRK